MHRVDDTSKVSWQRNLNIMFFAQLTSSAGFSSIIPFLPLYIKSLNTNLNISIELMAGLVISAQAFTMMIASPIWGSLADRYGHKIMVERAMFGGAVILSLMAFARSVEQLVLLRGIQGLITGTVAANKALVASTTPRGRTGYAMGLLQVGLSSGFALGPLIGGLTADFIGYSSVFFISAALQFIAGVLIVLGIKDSLLSNETIISEHSSLIANWRIILSSSDVLMTYGMRFMSQLGRNMIVPLVPLFILSLLPESAKVNTFTGLVVGMASGTTTFTAIYLGRLGDKVGHRRIVIASTILTALFFLPQGLVNTGWQFLILQALVGAALGGIIPTISALLAFYTRLGEEGTVYGLDNSVSSGSRVIGPLLGALVASWIGIRFALVATALPFLISGVIAKWGLTRPKDAVQ